MGRFRIFIYCLTVLGTTLIGVEYATVNFAWVCMVNASVSALPNETVANPYGGELPWGSDVQQNIFAAYSIGGLIMAIPAGWLVDTFGCRFLFTGGLMVSATASLLIPWSSQIHWGFTMALRIIVGLGASFYWPVVFNVSSHWAPKAEMGIGLALVASGFQFGQFSSILLAGLECDSVGWEWIFYFSGIANVAFAVLWFSFYRRDPSQHWLISAAEAKMILSERNRQSGTKPKTPWGSILRSTAVWGCMLARFCVVYITYVINSFTPTYLLDTLGIDVRSNGVLSSLPLLSQLVGRLLSGQLSDLFKFLSPTTSVKLFTTVAMLGGGVCALGLTFLELGVAEWIPVTLLCACMFLMSFITGGFQKSPLLIAPMHSAVLGSLLNVCGMAGAIIMPYVISAVISTGTPEAGWHLVFYTVVGSAVVGAVGFLIFGSGKLQSWAVDQKLPALLISGDEEQMIVDKF